MLKCSIAHLIPIEVANAEEETSIAQEISPSDPKLMQPQKKGMLQPRLQPDPGAKQQ